MGLSMGWASLRVTRLPTLRHVRTIFAWPNLIGIRLVSQIMVEAFMADSCCRSFVLTVMADTDLLPLHITWKIKFTEKNSLVYFGNLTSTKKQRIIARLRCNEESFSWGVNLACRFQHDLSHDIDSGHIYRQGSGEYFGGFESGKSVFWGY